MSAEPNICDYEGSNYRTDFWEGQGRDYEDSVERIAINRLLPFHGGRRILELGAGFGRLTDMYHAYEQVVLLDYSFSQMQYARDHHGTSRRFVYVAADAYNLPFRPGVFDAVSMIRVIHHMRDVYRVLSQVRHVTAPDGVFLLEHANKRNLKAMLRYALGQQGWNPYDREPHEFVELNIDFHPTYIQNMTRAAGFEVMRRLPVSYLRLGVLKRNVPTAVLVYLDSLLQESTWFYSPSVFLQSVALGDTPNNTAVSFDEPDALFAAPGTGNPLQREGDTMVDTMTGMRWAVRDGIYDFKAALD
jgi:ubiquinone/menaquinone biosynthesis C-methylase UbiE